jgi:hypothetical protein
VSGDTITWSWSGGGGSGLPVASYTLCVDGGCANVGANSGSTQSTFACGQSHSAYAYDTDTIGQNSQNSSTVTETTASCPPPSTTTPPPSKSIQVSWGSVPARYGNYMMVTWTGFGTGTLRFQCDEGGTVYPSSGSYYSVDATSSPFTAITGTCYDVVPNNTNYVITDGVDSNTIPSD